MKYTHGVSFLLEGSGLHLISFIRFCRVIWLADGIYTKAFVPVRIWEDILGYSIAIRSFTGRTEEVLSQIEKVVSKMPEVDHIMKISGRDDD